jgi:hypothetical protein
MSLQPIAIPPLNRDIPEPAHIGEWTRALHDRGYFVIKQG